MKVNILLFFTFEKITCVQKIPFIALCILFTTATCTSGYKDKKPEKPAVAKAIPSNTDFRDLSSVTDIEEVLCQTWQMADDLEALANADDDGALVMPFRTFHFSDDHTFTKNPRNAIEYGTWAYNNADKMITLTYTSSKETDRYKIRAIATDELKLTNAGLNTISILKFTGQGISYNNHQADPYHLSNNQWRIRPRQPETDVQIRKRLKDYLHFFILFYKDHIARNAETVAFYGFPSCLRWYAGGIYLKKREQMTESWDECFYNKAQAEKAYQMMDNIIGQRYTWSKDPKKNWLVKNAEVLKQMYERL